jgi:phage shock protein C
MAKKAKPSSKAAKREKQLDKRVEHFSEEVEAIGKRIEKRGGEWDSWFHRTFGIIGPFISSIFGILLLSLASWAITFMRAHVMSSFLTSVNVFILSNMGLFFLIFMFFSYSSYFSKVSPRGYTLFWPFVIAGGVTVGFWIAGNAISIANLSLGIQMLSTIVFYIENSFWWIFGFTLLFGYVLVAARKATGCLEPAIPARKSPARRAPYSRARLYRSGKDRILGGVCGGIAEYLGVDPVLIRLLWVIGTLAWGFGIIAYLVAWIIIPRNPAQKWA